MSNKTIYYVTLTSADAARLNQIMMSNYVFVNDNFVNGFGDGTLNYYNSDDAFHLVTDLLVNAASDLNIPLLDRNFISQILLTKKTYNELVTLGVIQPVAPAVNPGG